MAVSPRPPSQADQGLITSQWPAGLSAWPSAPASSLPWPHPLGPDPILSSAGKLLMMPQHPGTNAHLLQAMPPHHLWAPAGLARTREAWEGPQPLLQGREYVLAHSFIHSGLKEFLV